MLSDVPIRCSAVVDVGSWQLCKEELVLVVHACPVDTRYMKSW